MFVVEDGVVSMVADADAARLQRHYAIQRAKATEARCHRRHTTKATGARGHRYPATEARAHRRHTTKATGARSHRRPATEARAHQRHINKATRARSPLRPATEARAHRRHTTKSTGARCHRRNRRTYDAAPFHQPNRRTTAADGVLPRAWLSRSCSCVCGVARHGDEASFVDKRGTRTYRCGAGMASATPILASAAEALVPAATTAAADTALVLVAAAAHAACTPTSAVRRGDATVPLISVKF